MGRKNLLLGSLLIVLLCVSTEGRKKKGKEKFRGNMVNRNIIILADDPLHNTTEINPRTKNGTCSCICCEEPPDPVTVPPCLNDIIVAVDSSACFRAHYARMKKFVEKLANEIHKSGSETQFGANKTRLGIFQFSSNNKRSINLDDFDNYRQPPGSKALNGLIHGKINGMSFLGEGAFLNTALNLTVLEFLARPRPNKVIQEISAKKGNIRKVVIILTNGNSHPNVTQNDTDQSITFLKKNGVIVLPVSVTRGCSGTLSAGWEDGLCPNLEIMHSLSQTNTYGGTDFLAMRAKNTISILVKEATCKYVGPPDEVRDRCNNCTCDCELPIGPPGQQGEPGKNGSGIPGPKGMVGPKGDKGDTGEFGLPGVRGEKGIQGELGPIGDKGAIGPQGPEGDEGIEGLKGQKGQEGYDGIQGEKGDVGQKGDTGQQGEIGDKGDIGEQGPKGTQGDVGERGVEGPKGQTGEDGESVKGDRGDVGLKGTKGMIGPVGPPGLKGMKGRQGLCGKPGPAGLPGKPGLSGFDGQDGVTGPPGIQGPRGPEGITGEKGQRGLPGIDGQRGAIGPEGRPGSSGPQGEPGQRGADGRDSDVPGPEGPLGPTGERGDPGRNGLDGMQGPQGEQGSRGFPGPKGENCSVDLTILRPIIVEIIRCLLPGECGTECVPLDDPIDLVFLIDGSDSISREDFHKVQQWILKTVDRFKPMDRKIKLQLDVVQFSDNVNNSVHALIQNSSEEVRNDVEGIIQMRSGTKTYTGLSFVNAQVSPRTRTNSSKILITMTDGDGDESRVQSEIDEAKSFYNIMIGVGIGSEINNQQLKDFSHARISPISVGQFSALESIIDEIIQKSCKKIEEAPICCDNRVYSACATSCPDNCQQRDRVCISVCDTDNSCVCPRGTIERSPTDKTCIRPEECPNTRRHKRHVGDKPRLRHHHHKKRSAVRNPFIIQD